MERLKIKYGDHDVYQAGRPYFLRNFTRDSILSAILMNDSENLKKQLSFCASKQGKEKNPHTGEEEGKIFHEFPGFEIDGKSTEFNACDTTALYLIGHEVYQRQTKDNGLAIRQRENIEKAGEYIVSHLENDLFTEDPKFSAAKDFALKVTYWKDSEILDREDGKPVYPVVYTLAHIQNMRGLRSCAKLLPSRKLEEQADKMTKALQRLYDPKSENYCIAVDAQGPIKGTSSDSLHSLFYLSPTDISNKQLGGIVSSSKRLETKIGYRTLSPGEADRVKDKYHTYTVWPFEQAIIHAGARKFGLTDVQEKCLRIVPYLDTHPEIFTLDKGIKKGGCDPQLWTIAAKKYFESSKKEFLI